MHVRRMLVCAGAVVALAGVGAVAKVVDAPAAASHRGTKPGLLRAAAQYIGLTKAQLRQELPGHSLAQLAIAHGKSVAGLQQAMAAAAKAKLGRAVALGRLTQAQADQLLARLQARLPALVNRVFPATARAGRLGGRHGVGLLRSAAQYIGLTKAQLRQELPGHSLAQLAVAHGKSVAGLQQAMFNAGKARIDRALARSRVTQAQAAQLLARLQTRIARLVNHVFA
jgi:hypothetical protein